MIAFAGIASASNALDTYQKKEYKIESSASNSSDTIIRLFQDFIKLNNACLSAATVVDKTFREFGLEESQKDLLEETKGRVYRDCMYAAG